MMRNIRAYRQMTYAVLAMIAIILLGSIGFMILEDRAFFDAFWMTVITVLTVGYGDAYPSTFGGRIFALIIIPLGVGIVAYATGAVASILIEGTLGRTIWRRKMDRKIHKLKDHVILCGYGRVGEEVLSEMLPANTPVVVIEKNGSLLEESSSDILFIEGDATEDKILLEAGIEKARGLITTLPEDAANVFVTLTAKGLNEKLRIVARAEKVETEKKLKRAGADTVINPASISGKRMAMTFLKPHSMSLVDEIMHTANKEFDIEELKVGKSSNFRGKTIVESRIREQYGVNVVAIKRNNQVFSNPDPTEVLKEDDLVIVFGSTGNIEAFEKAIGEQKNK